MIANEQLCYFEDSHRSEWVNKGHSDTIHSPRTSTVISHLNIYQSHTATNVHTEIHRADESNTQTQPVETAILNNIHLISCWKKPT